MELHSDPAMGPISCGASLGGCVTPDAEISALLDAGRRYRLFKYWNRVRVGSSETRITGQGFNAVKFDLRKPARTVRRND